MGTSGILLINLGTPRSPRVRDVRRYLREFLLDGRVIDVAAWKRWLLVNGIIVPFRAPKSAHAYAQIWTERGSPLLWHTQDLAQKISARVRTNTPVAIAMRYQEPSIRAGLRELADAGVTHVVVVPLFPQYSTAAWGSAVANVYAEAARVWNTPSLRVVPPFYAAPQFLDLWATKVRPQLHALQPDLVLLSFHGLPERQIVKSSRGGVCLSGAHCCEKVTAANQYCYRAQCVATGRGIALRLGLRPEQYHITFQSRLGRHPWIRPYTDDVLVERARAGAKRLLMVSPSFTADCLETIEELGMRARADFLAHGGEQFALVPSLNSDDAWAETLVSIIGSIEE